MNAKKKKAKGHGKKTEQPKTIKITPKYIQI